ncbi:hypothetical protein CKO41_11230 [Thiococcus pfennigii]|nr:hypothetical protein [Thiococcus pfennigii]
MKAIHIAPPYSSLTASIRMKSRRRGGMRPAVFLNSTGFSSRHQIAIEVAQHERQFSGAVVGLIRSAASFEMLNG